MRILLILLLLSSIVQAQNFTLTGVNTYSNKEYTVDTVSILGNITLSNVKITASRIFIDGGSLTLKDSVLIRLRPKGEIMAMRARFIVEGENKTGFVNLLTSIEPGQSTAYLDQAPNWNVGDSIVLSSSFYDASESEWVQITSLSGSVLTFSPPAEFRHLTEVANTSRRIKITGTTKTGGWHLMLMTATETHVTGLEMAYGGVEGQFGKYPFHWHFAGDLPGSFVRYSAVHHSQQRGYTIHGTNHTNVSNNVLFDYKNHGFIIGEDGFSHDNTLDSNIAILGRPVDVNAFPTDGNLDNARTSGGTVQEERHTGGFWETGYNNSFHHNVAAGGIGQNGVFIDRSLGRPGYVFEVFKSSPSIHEDWIIHSYDRKDDFDDFGQFTAYRSQGNGIFVDQFNTNKKQIFNRANISYCRGGIWSESDSTQYINIDINNVSYGAALFKGILENATINKGISPQNLGGIVLQSSEGSMKAQKGSIALKNVSFSGFNTMFQVNADFEGPAYLQNVTQAGVRFGWTSQKGTLYDFDNLQVRVNGSIADFNTKFYIADDVDSCTQFTPSGWYSLQEGQGWWNNCSYPWAVKTHWVKASLSESIPAGADQLKIYDWYNTYGVEPLTPLMDRERAKMHIMWQNESPVFYVR